MKHVYHLSLSESQIDGAQYAILPGDPQRAKDIAIELDPKSKEIAYKREFRTFISYHNNIPVIVTSTGIGGPSTAIVIDELAKLGVKTFLRIGTTGAIQDYIQIGDVIITTGSVRMDGTSTHYAPIEYPAIASYHVLHALVQAASQTNIKAHIGISASSDTFYPGQERYDSYSGYVRNALKGMKEEWRILNVLNYEMESSTLLTVCSSMGLQSGCITGVVVNRSLSEEVTQEGLIQGEKNAINVGIQAIKILLSSH